MQPASKASSTAVRGCESRAASVCDAQARSHHLGSCAHGTRVWTLPCPALMLAQVGQGRREQSAHHVHGLSRRQQRNKSPQRSLLRHHNSSLLQAWLDRPRKLPSQQLQLQLQQLRQQLSSSRPRLQARPAKLLQLRTRRLAATTVASQMPRLQLRLHPTHRRMQMRCLLRLLRLRLQLSQGQGQGQVSVWLSHKHVSDMC